MWKSMVLVGSVTVGCATPYQPMGFRGGYAETPAGPNQYVVQVKVNGYTSQGTALAYAYQRASEICAAGFDILTGSASSSTTVIAQRYQNTVTVHEFNKPEIALAIRCKVQPAIARSLPPGPAQPALTDRWWWCITSSGGALGSCDRDRARCEARRSDSLASDPTTSLCEPQRGTFCFKLSFPATPADGELCHPSPNTCAQQRTFVLDNPDKATALSDCYPTS